MQPDRPQHNPAFPATQWTLIDRVGEPTSFEQRQALAALLQRYLPALRAHLVLERRISDERADDLLQSFVSQKVLEQRVIDRTDRDRGKFRTFLLRALNHFVIDQHRREHAAVRRPAGGAPEPIADRDVAVDDAPPPSSAFDREWARQVLDEAVRRMREECAENGRPEVWGLFEARILKPAMDGAEPASYESLLGTYRFASPAQASNVLMTAKRNFARHLRAVIGEYAVDEEQVEDELNDLREALATGVQS